MYETLNFRVPQQNFADNAEISSQKVEKYRFGFWRENSKLHCLQNSVEELYNFGLKNQVDKIT